MPYSNVKASVILGVINTMVSNSKVNDNIYYGEGISKGALCDNISVQPIFLPRFGLYISQIPSKNAEHSNVTSKYVNCKLGENNKLDSDAVKPGRRPQFRKNLLHALF
jgi:hypothetical protein